MGKRKLRKYTPRQRREALELAQEAGYREAASRLGIPEGTVSCWMSQARKASAHSAGDDRERWAGGDNKKAEGVGATALAEATPSRRVRRVYTPSERSRILEYADEHGVTKAAQKFGCSRWSIREWRRKVKLHSDGKADASPVVGSDADPKEERDRRVLQLWRKHPGLGPSQIRNQLRRDGMKISVHTVRVIMEENGYVTPKIRRTEVHDKLYEATRPGAMWHLDFLHRYINKLPIYVLLIIDDWSRFITGWAIWDGERVAAVIETFEEATERYGRPEKVLCDGGSAFWAWRGVGKFTRLLTEYEIDQLIAKTPQTNGKLENLNGNLQKELFNVERFFDLGETRRRLEAWVGFYNFRRTHHALGGLLVPADRYFGRADRVLAAIEAGRSADGIDQSAPVNERVLDLLRVTSRAGQLEVRLMGDRLWPPPQ